MCNHSPQTNMRRWHGFVFLALLSTCCSWGFTGVWMDREHLICCRWKKDAANFNSEEAQAFQRNPPGSELHWLRSIDLVRLHLSTQTCFPSPEWLLFRGPCPWELAGVLSVLSVLCLDSLWLGCTAGEYMAFVWLLILCLSIVLWLSTERAGGSWAAEEFSRQHFYQCAFIPWTQASRGTVGFFCSS